jgi:hypothetical protein
MRPAARAQPCDLRAMPGGREVWSWLSGRHHGVSPRSECQPVSRALGRMAQRGVAAGRATRCCRRLVAGGQADLLRVVDSARAASWMYPLRASSRRRPTKNPSRPPGTKGDVGPFVVPPVFRTHSRECRSPPKWRDAACWRVRAHRGPVTAADRGALLPAGVASGRGWGPGSRGVFAAALAGGGSQPVAALRCRCAPVTRPAHRLRFIATSTYHTRVAFAIQAGAPRRHPEVIAWLARAGDVAPPLLYWTVRA